MNVNTHCIMYLICDYYACGVLQLLVCVFRICRGAHQTDVWNYVINYVCSVQ